MKLAVAVIFAAAFAVSSSFGADVNVMGSDLTKARADAIRVATHDILNQPTALINKNTVASNNNVFIARSNLIFTQSDRMVMRQKVQDVMKKAKKMQDSQEQSSGDVDATATLTKSVMRAVSANDKDSALMTKASAVVAAKNADASTLAQRIADFVDAAGKREMETEEEQAIQSQTPRGVIVLVGTKDILRQPTAAVNKNIAKSDNQITIARSNVKPTQNDQIMLVDTAKVADAIASASAINVDTSDKKTEVETTTEATVDEPQYRQAFVYPKDGEADETMKNQEQFGLWGAGWGLGWRYPLGYWNTIGFGLYGGGCGLGFPLGGFFYC